MSPLLLILAWPAPREPISALDPVAPGETELSAGYTSTVTQGMVLANDAGMGRPWTLGVSHGWSQLEVRGSLAQSLDYPVVGLSVGWRPAWEWEWTPVLELGYSVSGGLKPPRAKGGLLFDQSSESAYWSHTPNARLRLIYPIRPELQLPLAVRLSKPLSTGPVALGGTRLELTSGLIWETSSCIQVGIGGGIEVADVDSQVGPVGSLLGNASLSCRLGGDR